MTKTCLITSSLLLEILKQIPNISSLKLINRLLISFYKNHELCEYLNRKIKILDISSHSNDRYFKSKK